MAGLQKGRCVYGCAERSLRSVAAWRAGFASKCCMATKKKSSGQTCWPGFKRVPGTKAGTKGSCAPKKRQTGAQKKADSRAAAARKRREE